MTDLDAVWIERERELIADQEERRGDVIECDMFWEPAEQVTRLEIQWDQARLDALGVLDNALLAGEEIDPLTVAYATSRHIDPDGPSYKYQGRSYRPGMIVNFNTGMIRGILNKLNSDEDSTIVEGE